MAQGPFALGHLGELTQPVPFDMVDEALAATRREQSRLRRSVMPGLSGLPVTW